MLRSKTGDERAPAHQRQRRADQPVGAADAGNRVTGAAPFLGDELGAARRRSGGGQMEAILRQRRRRHHREERGAHGPRD